MAQLVKDNLISKFRFADLFAGLGGFHLAANQVGGECVFACEIESDLQELYKKNFKQKVFGDIRKVIVEDVPDHDLLCAGFPCQPFSKAGAQIGWGDNARGTVFNNIIKILRSKKPRFVLLENVAHFVRHDNGNTYRKVQRALEKLGYNVDFCQYSPHEFGIPQIRERIYMIASLDSLEQFNWPVPNVTEPDLRSILDSKPREASPLSERVVDCLNVWQEFLDIIPSDAKLPSFPIWAMEFGATYPTEFGRLDKLNLSQLGAFRGNFGTKLADLSRRQMQAVLPSHALRKRDAFPEWKQMFIRQNREFFQKHKKALLPWIPKISGFPASLQKLEWNCQGEERHIWNYVIQFRASGVRVKRPSTSPSLVAMTNTQVPIIGWEKRYMTPRECARLQSMESLRFLPEGMRAFEALGNAVNVTVASSIIKELMTFSSVSSFEMAKAA